VQLINRELQNSGQKLQAKAEALIQSRKTQKNIELAVETLSLCLPGFCGFFSARQHICYSALYAVAHPSVCLSVCPSVTRVDQSKTVEVRIMQSSPQSSPMTLVF